MDHRFAHRDEHAENPWTKASAFGGGQGRPPFGGQAMPAHGNANGTGEAAASAMSHFADGPMSAGPSPAVKAEGEMRINQVMQQLGQMLKAPSLAGVWNPVLLQALDLADEAENKYLLLHQAQLLRQLYKHVNAKIASDTEDAKMKKSGGKTGP